jgi:glutamine amidotransferase
MGPALALIDYDAGNLRSISRALQLVGARATLVRSPEEVSDCDAIVLPGDGAFGPAMTRLNAAGFPPWIRRKVAAGTPLLGVCLGMQLLFEGSEEAPGVPGLALAQGDVRRLPTGVKVPHMGWNQVTIRRADRDLNLVGDGGYVYFVHSYVVRPADSGGVVATTTYGQEFPAIIRADNVLGLQFHPEKSGTTGLGLLRAIVGWMAATTADRTGVRR